MKVPRRAPAARPTARDRARPSGSRGAARPPARSARGRVPAPSAPPPVRAPGSGRRSPFTRRAAIFASVLFLVAVSVAYPAQRYVAQRAQIDELRSQVAAGTAHVSDLERDVAAASEPFFIEREARRRLHFVLPGEQAFRVTDPPASAADDGAGAAAAGDAAWWDQLLGSVAEASTPVEQLPGVAN